MYRRNCEDMIDELDLSKQLLILRTFDFTEEIIHESQS